VVDSYSLGDGNKAEEGDTIELSDLSCLIKEEQRMIILLSYRIVRIAELHDQGLEKNSILKLLEQEERQLFLDTLPLEE